MLITADYTIRESDFESKAILPEQQQQGQFNKGERCKNNGELLIVSMLASSGTVKHPRQQQNLAPVFTARLLPGAAL